MLGSGVYSHRRDHERSLFLVGFEPPFFDIVLGSFSRWTEEQRRRRYYLWHLGRIRMFPRSMCE